MLNVSKLSASYGAIQAVRTIDLEVKAGSVFRAARCEWCGKSTTLRAFRRACTGPFQARSGSGTRRSRKLPLHSVVRRALPSFPKVEWWSHR